MWCVWCYYDFFWLAEKTAFFSLIYRWLLISMQKCIIVFISAKSYDKVQFISFIALSKFRAVYSDIHQNRLNLSSSVWLGDKVLLLSTITNVLPTFLSMHMSIIVGTLRHVFFPNFLTVRFFISINLPTKKRQEYLR